MNFKNLLLLLICYLISANAFAQQSISGDFPALANQPIKLVGFQDFGNYIIDNTTVSEKGQFTLHFTKKDWGMGYLSAENQKAYFVVLAKEDVKLKGEYFKLPETVNTLLGKENQLFAQYASEHPRREQALNAWDYLVKIYKHDSLFTPHTTPQQAIKKEKQRIKNEDSLFLANLNQDSYVHWYLPLRKLVSSVSTIAQYRSKEIPVTIKRFRAIDYTDERLYKSGLLRESIENYIWLIENSGKPLDSVNIEMKISIDSIIDNLATDSEKLNKITDFLFKLLEKRSFFKVSEYLALKVLNDSNYVINKKLASKLENYRAMKVGNKAPDFEFSDVIFTTEYSTNHPPKKLSDLSSNYIVLIFGASWCTACPPELMQIAEFYQNWKNHDVEVVFVSLDDDKEIFRKFAHPFPFISTSDYQKWESPIVKSYHVFATPTIFLLDNKQKIVLRPNSVEQLDAWIDWYLVKKK